MIKSDRSRCWKLSVASYLVMGGDCLSIAVATTGRAMACRQLNLECRQSNPFTKKLGLKPRPSRTVFPLP
jgi:hypothetical protein